MCTSMCLCVAVVMQGQAGEKDGERSDERFTWTEKDLEETMKKENH